MRTSFTGQVSLILHGATVDEATLLADGTNDPTVEQELAVRYLRLGWDTAATAEKRAESLDADADPFEGLTAKVAS